MSYANWDELCTTVERWASPHTVSFMKAERSVAENSENAKAMYRNTTLLPGTLQIPGYVDSLCRSKYSMELNRENTLLRMARQTLLHAAKVRQFFLVDEAALTYPPGGWTHMVAPQILHMIHVVHEDMLGDNLLDFRVVPNQAVLPREEEGKIYDDTFALFSAEDKVTGFTDAWRDGEIFPAEGENLDRLIHTWDEVGKIALSREASLARMEYRLHTRWDFGPLDQV